MKDAFCHCALNPDINRGKSDGLVLMFLPASPYFWELSICISSISTVVPCVDLLGAYQGHRHRVL